MIMAVGVLAGCNLFERNERRAMMTPIARINPIGDHMTEPHYIYMWELLQLISQQGGFHPDMTREDREMVIDSMINQLIVRRFILIDIDRMLHNGEMPWRAGRARVLNEYGHELRDENNNHSYVYRFYQGTIVVFEGGQAEFNVFREENNLTGEFREEPVYDFTDANRVRQIVYGAIDQTLESIRAGVLTDFDMGVPEVAPPSTDTPPTSFPVRPARPDEIHDEDEPREEEKWSPDRARWPGYFMTNANDISFENQVIERFLALVRERTDAEENLEITESDESRIAKDNLFINGIISGNREILDRIYAEEGMTLNAGLTNVYPMLFNPVWTEGHVDHEASNNSVHMVYILLGRQAIEQVRIERLQETIIDNVEVREDQIRNHFNDLQRQQQLRFRNNWDAYAAAIRGGETILYHPVNTANNQRFFYVKHILLPFSPVQTQQLTTFRQSPAGQNPVAVREFRDTRLAPYIVVPDRVNGESDYSTMRSAQQVFDIVLDEVGRGDLRARERAFTDLIYRFNTDPGAFGNNRGYLMESELLAHESEQMVQEFADAARALFNEPQFSPGDVYPRKVITDFGIHIMYFASVVPSGTSGVLVDIDSFESPGQITRINESIESELLQILQGGEFTRWQNERIVYFTETRPETYETFPSAWRTLARRGRL